MSTPRDTFRIAVRKFGPFESAIQKQWESFCRATGCTLRLEAQALDLPELHETLFERDGLVHGEWDVSFVVTDWIAEAMRRNALLDLAPKLRDNPPDGYPDDWTDSLLRYQRFENVVLALPYHDGPECLIYRKDLFEAAGVTPPKTWEEFHALARKFTDPAVPRWGTVFAVYPDGHNAVYDFCLQLWTHGGELFDANGQLSLNTPAAENAMTFYREIVNDTSAVHPECWKYDSVQTGLAFARGEVAMMVNWFGFAAMCETIPESQVKGKIAVAPVPAASGHPSVSMNVYWLLGIAAGSPHAETAYAFLRHCVSSENDKMLTLEGGIGCRKSTWHDGEINRVIPFYSSLEVLHTHARELPRLSHWADLAVVIDRLTNAAMDSKEPIQSLLSRAQGEADRIAV